MYLLTCAWSLVSADISLPRSRIIIRKVCFRRHVVHADDILTGSKGQWLERIAAFVRLGSIATADVDGSRRESSPFIVNVIVVHLSRVAVIICQQWVRVLIGHVGLQRTVTVVIANECRENRYGINSHVDRTVLLKCRR